MSKEISQLSLLMDKVLKLGELDRWLRDMVSIIPNKGIKNNSLQDSFNQHHFAISPDGRIGPRDVESLVGFRQLLTRCSQQNVRVDLKDKGDILEIRFEPAQAFCKSRIFGQDYTNVLPVLFGERRNI